MAYKKKKGEVYPLLSTDWTGAPTYKQKPIARNIRRDEDSEVVIEDDDEFFDIVDQKKKRTVNLVWADVTLLILDFLQILALLQSMSLRWTWSGSWLRSTWFIFAFNVDVWEIMKFAGSYTYIDVQDNYIASADIDVSFRAIAIGWFIAAGALCLIYGVTHIVMKCYYPRPWARRFASWFQYAFLLITHALSLPIGIVLFRLWQCEKTYSKVDTINSLTCFEIAHWYLLAPAVFCMVLLFAVYPVFLIWRSFCDYTRGKAENYVSILLLKETEYKLHLNWSWLYDGMWLYSSFKSRGIYYRPMIQFMKLILLVIYVAAFNDIPLQSLLTAIALGLFLFIFLFIRPFRLTSCNVLLLLNFLFLLTDAFLGALRAAYDAYTVPTAWMLADYMVYFLTVIQVCWLVSAVALLVYLVSRTLCHTTGSCYKRPVWPNMASSGAGQLTTETRKYMKTVIKAKVFYEKARRVPVMFAPVHEMARHIQILNAYFREAEYIHDPLQMALWEELDNLIDLHADVSPRSLFAESIKQSIHKTAERFMTMLPMLSQRLAQRDYDLILVPPVKRRMLFKMWCMGMFLNGRAEKVAKQRGIMEPGVERVCPSLPADHKYEEEDGYYEDLYPRNAAAFFTDDVLNIVVDNSSDEEETEEEDNVYNMLKTLPEVGLIDLEPPAYELPEVEQDSRAPTMLREVSHVPPRPPMPQSASTSRSTPQSTSQLTPPGSGGGYTGPLQQREHGLMASMLRDLKPYRQETQELSPLTPQPGIAELSPLTPPPGGEWQGSAASLRDEGRSPTSLGVPYPTRPASAGSVISQELSRPTSADSRASEQGMSHVNPGYIPGNEDGGFDVSSREGEFLAGREESVAGDNQGYIPDDQTDDYYEDSDGGGLTYKSTEEPQMAGDARPERPKRKKKKQKKKIKH